jgi:hypothetical protein
VRIRGVITHFDEMRSNTLFIFDGTSGQFIEAAKDGSLVAWGPIRSGDTIEVLGYTARGGFAPTSSHGIRDPGDRPTGTAACAMRVAGDGRHDCEHAEASGVSAAPGCRRDSDP